MDEKEKPPMEKMMERDCIILLTANEVLNAMMTIVQRARPGWFESAYEGANIIDWSIDTKCKGENCAQYRMFSNVCGLSG